MNHPKQKIEKVDFRMNDIAVFYCFARSGGTLINRCLGCIKDNLVLSEVNPHGALLPVETQALDWLKLVSSDQFKNFHDLNYGQKISFLNKNASALNKHLIIRDWSTLNFLRNVYWEYFSPSMILEQGLYLSNYDLQANCVVVTRQSACVYESIVRCFPDQIHLSVEEFSESYLAYSKAVCNYPVIHFEKFCAEPEVQFQKLCGYLGVKFERSFLTQFHRFNQCTGDNQLSSPSKLRTATEIMVPTKKRNSKTWQVASTNENCRKADELLGYEI